MSFGLQFERAMVSFFDQNGYFLVHENEGVVYAAIEGGSTVEFATAVCNENDRFSESVGIAIALERFMEGRTVIIPKSHWQG